MQISLPRDADGFSSRGKFKHIITPQSLKQSYFTIGTPPFPYPSDNIQSTVWRYIKNNRTIIQKKCVLLQTNSIDTNF